MIGFIRSNIWEINRSSNLQKMGAILSVLHFINYFYWRKFEHLFATTPAKPLLCWDFFQSCENFIHLQNSSLLSFIIVTYAVLAALSFVTFLFNQFSSISWVLLTLTNAFMLVIFFSDASLNRDIYSLVITLNLALLFVPGKAPLLRGLVIVFYFLTAYRELNPELLSGISLHDMLPYNYKLLEWISSLGVLMKFTLPVLLISPIGQRVLLALVLLGGYHVFYFYALKDFKSVVMLGMMVFFIFDYFARKRLEFESLYQSYAHPEPSRLWLVGFIGVFLMIQTPLLGRSPINRFLYVNEPYQTSECHLVTFMKNSKQLSHITNGFAAEAKNHLGCHPRIAFNAARELCLSYKQAPDFKSLSATFTARRFAEQHARVLFHYENVCDSSIVFQTGVVKNVSAE